MRSSFYILEVAKSALQANQIALDVTGQNVANVNTENYTRQTADMTSMNYYSGISKFALPPVSNLGQGVGIGKIFQIRDEFLDARFRRTNAEYNTSNTSLSVLKEVENIFDETTNDGLHAMLNDFYNQLQGLTNNPDNTEFSNITRSSAEKITQVLNNYASRLSEIKDMKMSDLEIGAQEINVTIDNINQINILIKDQTLRGSASNELLDMRNAYIDTLSGYMNITAKPEMDGSVSILSEDVSLLDSTFSISVDGGGLISLTRTYEDVSGVSTSETFNPSEGIMNGYIQTLNGAGAYDVTGKNSGRGLVYYEKALNSFAEAFASTYNGINVAAGGLALFSGTAAADIEISASWLSNPDSIISANNNVIKMINAMDDENVISPYYTGTFEGFSRSLMSDIAVDTGYYDDMSKMREYILNSVKSEREAIMGVSTDEETINMTKYQKAYQAAARLMTVIDENLETLINKTGIVGR